MHHHRQRGMTLLELLVVVAIIAVLSAVAIWNYFIAINRSRQKRTMADIRVIALSWEMYAQESESYLPAAALYEFPETPLTAADLQDALAPKYLKNFPTEDGWGNPFDFAIETDPGNPNLATSYAIRSRGADGLIDETYDELETKSFDNDIIFAGGAFIVAPENK